MELDQSSATALAGLAESLVDNIPYEDPTAGERLRRAEGLVNDRVYTI